MAASPGKREHQALHDVAAMKRSVSELLQLLSDSFSSCDLTVPWCWAQAPLPTGCSQPTSSRAGTQRQARSCKTGSTGRGRTFAVRTLTALLKLSLNCTVDEDFLFNSSSCSPSHQSDLSWGLPTSPSSCPIFPHKCFPPVSLLQACLSGEPELNR